MYWEGVFGTVCDDLFDSVDASVACCNLGFDGGTSVAASPGTGETVFDNVACAGSEHRLVDRESNG
ncbi:MAG: hypothetical protein ACJAZO_002504 [Myxococcota bacterium]|jgi:hypothetical protein